MSSRRLPLLQSECRGRRSEPARRRWASGRSSLFPPPWWERVRVGGGTPWPTCTSTPLLSSPLVGKGFCLPVLSSSASCAKMGEANPGSAGKLEVDGQIVLPCCPWQRQTDESRLRLD